MERDARLDPDDARMSAAADLRLRVAAANVAIKDGGLVTLSFGNVSGVDRDAGVLVIKPSGVPYAELRPEMMVVIDLEGGQVVDGDLRPSTDTPTHRFLYRTFPEIGGVVHTHSSNATAWAQAGRSIPCLGTTHADYFRGSVPVSRPLRPEEIAGEYEWETGRVIAETLAAQGRTPTDAPAVLAPVVAGEADLVLGSRVLGRAETSDNVRAAGVRVFSGLVRLLTGVRVSDTSSGLRAMVAELTARVTLDQPQYQSSELLLGAIAHGYRVAERPVTMHARTAGQSAKGTNLVYGLSYARVILRTWWRERRAAARVPRAQPIPAERLDG